MSEFMGGYWTGTAVTLAATVVVGSCMPSCDAHADTTARCIAAECPIAQPKSPGPGVLQWSFSTGPGEWREPQRYKVHVPEGEFAYLDIPEEFLAGWQEATGQECVRTRYRWLRHATASKLWSEPSPWCLYDEAGQ